MTNSSERPASVANFDLQGPNAHLADYIKYFSSLKEPGFAVLITGEWGTGKTYLMRQLLPWEGDNKKSYYVSFFGLKNAAEVDAAIYAEMYPRNSAIQERLKDVGEATRGLSAYGFNAGGLIGGGANLISAYLRKEIDTSKPIIFDDLERSSMEQNKRNWVSLTITLSTSAAG
jgi:KAP family P-loop domain